MNMAHKGWWDESTGLYFGCANEPGFGDVRDFIIVCNEASDAKYQGLEIRCMVYMLDVTVIQTNDVDLDYRGLAYISDRAGTGLHVIEYLG